MYLNLRQKTRDLLRIFQDIFFLPPPSFLDPLCFLLANGETKVNFVGNKSWVTKLRNCITNATKLRPVICLFSLFSSLSKFDIAETIFSIVQEFRYHIYRETLSDWVFWKCSLDVSLFFVLNKKSKKIYIHLIIFIV